ncbi:acyl-CoA dehydrogenase family protein [Amycolatopsis jejuensis]|uniref:acyl-CoA dehydrogenase family protein n=1 Tax=Amycolatopsis jejuensis TaxID=330084 RepID=UPI00052519B9|nr:acyl-CoA dehydrogenase family protein [Amycolatopsis jejuensis]
MEWTLTDDQEDLRRTVRRFLRDKAPLSASRKVLESDAGYDPSLWQQMAGLGLHSLTIPEEHGGAGCGQVELGVVLQEFGRALTPSAFFSTVVLAVNALLLSDAVDAQAKWLPSLAAGELTATVAIGVDGEDQRWGPAGNAVAVSGSTLLTGRVNAVLDGATADLVLVVAESEAGPSLFAVDSEAPGLRRTPLRTLDLVHRQARLEFADVPATPIGLPGTAGDLLAKLFPLVAVAAANEQLGAAEQVLENSVEYARTRVQFGRPIGSFQAVKHKLAEMFLDIELAKSAVRVATWTADHDPAELAPNASIAKAYSAAAYWAAAVESIQVHGGIGFTWEHDAHLYYRHARSMSVQYGDGDLHRELIMSALETA